MGNLHVYLYSLIEGDDWTPHCGLTTGTSPSEVRKDIGYNYIDPRHVRVTQVKELDPVLDERGDVVGYARNDMPD